MKQLEFDSKISEDRMIEIPQGLAQQVGTHQVVHVVVSVPDDPGRQPPANGKIAALMATFGSCKDESLALIFEEIDAKRHRDQGRQINLP